MQRPYRSGQQVIVKSCITEEPEASYGNQTFQIEGIYVKASDIVRYSFGDCVETTGTLGEKVITPFYRQLWLIDPAIIKNGTLWEERERVGFFHALYYRFKYRSSQLRGKIQEIFYRFFPAPQSQLLAGIVLGSKERFGTAFYHALIQSGTIHIVAASGMNLTIFVGTALNILAVWCGRKKAIVLTWFLCWFYVFLSGLQASIIRAGTMLSLIWLGQIIGRGSNSIRILFITAGVMLIVDPLLVFDTGFWLSVTATGGLVLISPGIQEAIEKRKPIDRFLTRPVLQWIEAKPSLVSSAAAYFATLPIILFSFHQTNPLSLLPNILILWLIPDIMAIGGLTAMVGLISMPVAVFFGRILWPPLTAIVILVKFFGNQFGGKITFPETGYFSLLLVILYYFVLLKLLVRPEKSTIL